MKKSILLFISISLGLSASVAQVRKIEIDPNKTFQTIEYFAASDAWSGNFVGKYWDETEKSNIAQWLFSNEFDESGNPRGIGLSQWRVNVGAGTFEQVDADIMPLQRRAESFLTVDGRNYDWGKSAGQQYFMEKAAELGCNNFLLFSNSPLVQYTLNGKGWSSESDAANIKTGYYDKYGEYLAEVALYYTKKGLNISYISPINEPQVLWNSPRQEGSPWRRSEMRDMYIALDEALSKKPELTSVKMMVGESADLKVIYQKSENLRKRFDGDVAPDEQMFTFFDPKSDNYIGNLKHVAPVIAGHSYHDHANNDKLREIRRNVNEISQKYNIDFQQTEWCLLPNYLPPMDGFTSDWDPGNRGNMQVGLLLGRLIHSDFVDGGATAWGYWKGMELKGDHALVALHANEANILKGGNATTNKILWALGNYSFFIRPGYLRIETQGADDLNKLAVSSYVSPSKNQIVSVFVNSSFDKEAVEFKLPDSYKNSVTSISVYQTNERSDLVEVPFVLAPEMTYSIPARTISTIVFDIRQ